MKKQLVRLTEEDLHQIIESTVQRIITENYEEEGMWDTMKSFGGQYFNRGKKSAQQFGQNVKQSAQQFGQKMGDNLTNITTDVKNTWTNAKRDGAMKDMQKAFINFKKSVNNYVNNGGKLDRMFNSRLSGLEKTLNNYNFNY